MRSDDTPQAKLTTVASFPRHYFLENMAIRGDNSIIVTVMNHMELWYVPPVNGTVAVEPLFLHTFAQHATGIIEAEPDVFYISTSMVYTTRRVIPSSPGPARLDPRHASQPRNCP